MPKSKHAPALFELIGNHGEKKAADKLALPKWLKTAPQQDLRISTEPPPADQPIPIRAAGAPATRTPENDAGTQSASAAFGPSKSNTHSGKPAGPNDDSEPVARVRSGRLELSLKPTNVVLIGGGIVIALMCFYFVGRGLAGKSTKPVQVAGNTATADDDVKAALAQPANGQILDLSRPATTLMAPRPPAKAETDRTADKPHNEKAGTPPAATPGEAAAPSGGPNRIVIESFKVEHQKSAEHVRKWLLDNYGLKTELKPAGDRIWLVTAEGIDLEKPGQREYRDKLIEDLKSLGESCARELAGKNLTPYRITGPYTRRFDK
jgi:hypothetical protein